MVKREDLHADLLIPPTYPPRAPAKDDPRIGDWLSRNSVLRPGGIALIGFPFDIGVRRNGGRPGAAAGPGAFRAAFVRLTPDAQGPDSFSSILERSVDLGDLRVGDQHPPDEILEAAQSALAVVVEDVLRADGIPVVVGGGHETSFGHYRGCHAVLGSLTVLNWDAHADVRPLIDGRGHSGSPFRQMIEHDADTRYIVAGLLAHSVASEHVRYIRRHGGEAILREEISDEKGAGGAAGKAFADIYGFIEGPALVSFDLDAVEGASAPGVSAPSAGGFTPREWAKLAYLAGTNANVRSMDVVELNPEFDLDGRTARIAALTAWMFIRGLCGRNNR